jgi:hypothetical protein
MRRTNSELVEVAKQLAQTSSTNAITPKSGRFDRYFKNWKEIKK